jgi:thiamine pyridinylase
MKKLLATAVLLLAFGCASAPKQPPIVPRSLTVSLFPYIPDAANDNFKALIVGLTRDFEAQHPDIRLTLVISDANDPYDPSQWPRLFSANGPSAVEVDTLTLGDLRAGGYIAPVDWDDPTFSFARDAARVDGRQYAIPTWVCMTFFYSKQAGGRGQPPYGAMSGSWSGSWMLPSYYLVAYTDRHGYVPLDEVMKPPLDRQVVDGMRDVMSTCTISGSNDCLNTTFANKTGLAQQQYVQGKYSYTTGFSESSFYILANGGERPAEIQPMLVSPGENRPLAFTDGLTVNAASCKDQCAEDVKTFAKFLNSPTTRAYICFSKDAPPGTPPRYLSPASASFYHLSEVQNDWMYQQFRYAFEGARGFPNHGFPAARKTLNAALCDALRTIPNACGR